MSLTTAIISNLMITLVVIVALITTHNPLVVLLFLLLQQDMQMPEIPLGKAELEEAELGEEDYSSNSIGFTSEK